MSISIQTNVASMMALDNVRVNNDFQSRTVQRLTSGYRINSSGDDAAGLAVANNYRGKVAELTQGVRNANDGVSLMQVIDGGLNNITKIVDRLRTLATQSASDTLLTDTERTTLDAEFGTLLGEIDRQAANIGLNVGGTNLRNDISVYIGGGSDQTNAQVTIDLSAAQVDSAGLTIDASTVDTKANALLALTALETAVTNLGSAIGTVGTAQNRMGYAINLAYSQSSSYSAAESRIRDADVATEASNLTKAQVLQQASMAALAQANSMPQAVLSLFR